MSLSSPIPLTRLRNTTPTHDEIQEVDEIFHNLNASVIFDSPDTVPGPQWKRYLHALLEQPTSSSSAFVMHVFITSLIIISALVTVFETVPTFRKISGAVWFGFETTLVALFTIEYIARSLAWSGSWRLFFGWFTCTSSLPCSFLVFCCLPPYHLRRRKLTRCFLSVLWDYRSACHSTLLHRDRTRPRYGAFVAPFFSQALTTHLRLRFSDSRFYGLFVYFGYSGRSDTITPFSCE